MNRYIRLLIFVFCIVKPPGKLTIFMAGDSTMSVKEARAFPETGWGMPFAGLWDSTVSVVNLAKNGRSTRTFINEGLWQRIMDQAGLGDYICIQFGHNDESPEKTDRYTPPDSFVMNLGRFIRETRAKGATPILFTPVGRRRFDPQGQVMETHQLYSGLVRELAIREKVMMIDLDSISREIYQQYGAQHSRALFLHLNVGEHPNYPEGKEDNTHFNEIGAKLIAEAVIEEIRIKVPELAKRIRPEIN